MNKVLGDIIRLLLKVGGGILISEGWLSEGDISDAEIEAITGLLLVVIGTVWGLLDAKEHNELKKEINDAT